MFPAVHPLRCRCGALQGHVELNGRSNRMVCYCQDCQDFARFLGPADKVLDAQGGSEVVRLSDKGMLRWYAACCRTPVGNTMTGRNMPFAGLLAQCLDTAPLEAAFGPVRASANTESAIGEPKPRAYGLAGAMLRILSMVLGNRLSGRYKDTPFFTAAGAPVAEPKVLSVEERARLQP